MSKKLPIDSFKWNKDLEKLQVILLKTMMKIVIHVIYLN